jgi:hypothetical protein
MDTQSFVYSRCIHTMEGSTYVPFPVYDWQTDFGCSAEWVQEVCCSLIGASAALIYSPPPPQTPHIHIHIHIARPDSYRASFTARRDIYGAAALPLHYRYVAITIELRVRLADPLKCHPSIELPNAHKLATVIGIALTITGCTAARPAPSSHLS